MSRVLVTGSSGHLGEALARTLKDLGRDVVGVDMIAGPFTTNIGSIVNRKFVKSCMTGVETVLHAATLHKPHIATHTKQDFIDTNITGTLNLLEEATKASVHAFVFTSTTSVFGDAMASKDGTPAVWVTEDLCPIPKNIYGATKLAAEDLCQLFHRNNGLACIVLRTSRFFPEDDDNKDSRAEYSNENLKMNEFLYRRVEIEDVVSAHILAAKQALSIGFRKYIVSAKTPFEKSDLSDLANDALKVLRRIIPGYEFEYSRRGWKIFSHIDRVYVSDRIRNELGWQPKYDFEFLIGKLSRNEDPRSQLAKSTGSKGYHSVQFSNEPYPVE